MGKSPLILAALASEAVPGLRFRHVQAISNDVGAKADSALLTSESGEHYIIRLAKPGAAGADQDTELAALQLLSRLNLPFEVAKMVGETRAPDGSRAMLFSFIYGSSLDLETLNPNSPLTENIGAAVAAIHNIDREVLSDAGFPEYDASAIVQSKIAELDRALDTGKVPASLLQRWEHAFEDLALFRFQPTVIHANLDGDSVMVNDQQVSGIMSWSGLKIADPAEDLSWIAGSFNSDAAYNIMVAYQTSRPGADANLRTRAQLYSEFALARWLLHGVRLQDEAVIEDATQMLRDLADDVEAGSRGPLTAPLIQTQTAFEAKDLPTAPAVVAEFSDVDSDLPATALIEVITETTTETEFAQSEFNESGFNESGFNESGFNESGFNDSGLADVDSSDTEALPVYEATITSEDDSTYFAETVEIVLPKDSDLRQEPKSVTDTDSPNESDERLF